MRELPFDPSTDNPEPITRARMLALSGFGAAEPGLLAERGERALYAFGALAGGTSVACLVLVVTAPALRAPLAFSLVLGVTTLVALVNEARRLLAASSLLLLGAMMWGFGRLSISPPEVWVSSVGAGALASGAIFAIARQLRARYRKRVGLDAVARLYSEIERFNETVAVFRFTAALSDASRKPLGAEERRRVVRSLWRTRDDLERALVTERLLRENRGLLEGPAAAAIDLAPRETARVRVSGEHCSALLRDSISAAADVRDELERLLPKP